MFLSANRSEPLHNVSLNSIYPLVFSGKPEELPRKPLGQELPVLLTPLAPSRGKPPTARGCPKAGLSLHIISNQADSISPDQSPTKDINDLHPVDHEEVPLPSPDPIIIHNQSLYTPDDFPLTGPPPYQPPESQATGTADRLSRSYEWKIEEQADHSGLTNIHSTDNLTPVTISTEGSSKRVLRTLSAPIFSAHSESETAAEIAEGSSLVQLSDSLSSNRTLSQDQA